MTREHLAKGMLQIEPIVKPQCDVYTMMAFRLSDGVISEIDKIFMMNESDVYLLAYLKRVDAINHRLAEL